MSCQLKLVRENIAHLDFELGHQTFEGVEGDTSFQEFEPV
jgi:hypothetical protein